MKVKILYFAMAKDIRGAESEVLQLSDDTTTTTLFDLLQHAHPGLKELAPTIRLAVNETFIDAPCQLKHNDVMAIIPPVTGG